MAEAGVLPLDAESRVDERPGEHQEELRLWLRLFSCEVMIEREIRRRLRDGFATTLPRFDLMAQLDKAPAGMNLGELSRRLMVSNGNVTGLVERLVAEGLLDCQAAPHDRRNQLVRLTRDGRRAFRAMAAAHEGWIAELFAGLGRQEVERLMALLAKAKGSARHSIDKGRTK